MNDDERIARMEARLALIEARIATLEAQPQAPLTITFPPVGGTARPPFMNPFTYDTYNESPAGDSVHQRSG